MYHYSAYEVVESNVRVNFHTFLIEEIGSDTKNRMTRVSPLVEFHGEAGIIDRRIKCTTIQIKVYLRAMDAIIIAANKAVSNNSAHREVRGLEGLWWSGLGGVEAVDKRGEAKCC